ncbi:hypothetical protein MNBD_PLANCTO02-1646 [hydrothermal vent metagenome]|uniref:Uncharacterized protein n=1 Tax=hydrothermal vent metagenome TaxID=652676 RepID=A0A3B1DV11_9ZZZZ
MNELPPNSTKPKYSFWLRLISWKVLLPLFLLFVIVSTPFIVRLYYLSQVPLAEISFDLKKYATVNITDEENGYIEYKEAVAKLVMSSKPKGGDDLDIAHDEKDWSHATPAIKKWLKDNQKALAIWKKGTGKTRFLSKQPQENSTKQFLESVKISYTLNTLIILNAKRLAYEGKLEESKEWLQAMFLFGCQWGQHTDLSIRLCWDSSCYRSVYQTFGWANDSRVTRAQLQQAMRDCIQNELQVVPLSTSLKYGYFSSKEFYLFGEFKKWCEETSSVKGGFFQRAIWDIKFFIQGEPERSWRLQKHAIVNLLSEIDKPIFDQSLQTIKYHFFKNLSNTLSADKLETIIQQSKYTSKYFFLDGTVSLIYQRRKTRRRILQVVLAAQIYKRKHGKFPATTADLLAEGDLKTMPLDTTKRVKIEITYRHKKGLTAVYIVKDGCTDHGGVDASWYNPERDYGYVLEGRTPGVEY